MLLNLLNLYSLIFALFSKIDGMSKDLDLLKPTLNLNDTTSNSTLNITESMALKVPRSCIVQEAPCGPCNIQITIPIRLTDSITIKTTATAPFSIHQAYTTSLKTTTSRNVSRNRRQDYFADNNQNIDENNNEIDSISLVKQQMDMIKDLINKKILLPRVQATYDADDYNDTLYDTNTDPTIENIDDDDYPENNYPSTIINGAELDLTQGTMSTKSELYVTEYEVTTYSSTTITEQTEQTSTDYSTYIDEDTSEKDYETSSITIDDHTDFTKDMYTYADTVPDATLSTLYEYNVYKTSTMESSISDTIETSIDSLSLEPSTNSDSTDTTTNVDITETTIKFVSDSEFVKTSPSFETTQPNIATGIFGETTESTSKATILTTLTPKMPAIINSAICPNMSFNCTVNCGGENITQVFFISNCTIVDKLCYTRTCTVDNGESDNKNYTAVDIAYRGEGNRIMYNLTKPTRKKLLKLCWETMFGQELVKLTMMDLVRYIK